MNTEFVAHWFRTHIQEWSLVINCENVKLPDFKYLIKLFHKKIKITKH